MMEVDNSTDVGLRVESAAKEREADRRGRSRKSQIAAWGAEFSEPMHRLHANSL